MTAVDTPPTFVDPGLLQCVGQFNYASDAFLIHPNGKLSRQPWGFKEFVALDLHGNALRFAEDVTGGLA